MYRISPLSFFPSNLLLSLGWPGFPRSCSMFTFGSSRSRWEQTCGEIEMVSNQTWQRVRRRITRCLRTVSRQCLSLWRRRVFSSCSISYPTPTARRNCRSIHRRVERCLVFLNPFDPNLFEQESRLDCERETDVFRETILFRFSVGEWETWNPFFSRMSIVLKWCSKSEANRSNQRLFPVRRRRRTSIDRWCFSMWYVKASSIDRCPSASCRSRCYPKMIFTFHRWTSKWKIIDRSEGNPSSGITSSNPSNSIDAIHLNRPWRSPNHSPDENRLKSSIRSATKIQSRPVLFHWWPVKLLLLLRRNSFERRWENEWSISWRNSARRHRSRSKRLRNSHRFKTSFSNINSSIIKCPWTKWSDSLSHPSRPFSLSLSILVLDRRWCRLVVEVSRVQRRLEEVGQLSLQRLRDLHGRVFLQASPFHRRRHRSDLSSSIGIVRALRGFHWFLSNIRIDSRQDEVRRRERNRRRIQRSVQSLFLAGECRRGLTTPGDGTLSTQSSRRMSRSSLHHSGNGFTSERCQWQIRSVHRDRIGQSQDGQSRGKDSEQHGSRLRQVGWRVKIVGSIECFS